VSCNPLGPGLERARRHERGFEYTMLLSIVFRPVGRQDPPVGAQSTEGWRPRHRHDHAHGRNIDAGLIEKGGRPAEDADVSSSKPNMIPRCTAMPCRCKLAMIR